MTYTYVISDKVNAPWWVSWYSLINTIILIAFLALFIYGFVLFLKFTRLGIKALKVYIDKNRPDNNSPV
jgi:hypothetical protein